MANGGTNLSKVLLYVYNVVIFVCGLGCLGVGMWMQIDKNVKAYFTAFRRNPDDNVLLAATGVFIGAGIIICLVALLGCFGTVKKIKWMLGIYVMMLTMIFVMQATIGFLAVAFRYDIHIYVKDGMKAQLELYYQHENQVGYAWNRIQVRNRCCGVDGSWDYSESMWWHEQNPGVEDINEATVHVPDSCCKLEFNQDRDPSRVDPQNPRPKDRTRCNEDAAGKKDSSSDFVNNRGCYAALLDFIYIHIDLIMGLALVAGFIQVFGLVISIVVFFRMEDPKREVKY